jgi:hypothetical protein
MAGLRPVGIAIVLVASCVAACTALYVRRANPVPFSLGSDAKSDHGLEVLNPFRDTVPERTAVALLNQLKQGDCFNAFRRINPDSASVETGCEKERDYPLQGWRLEARGTNGNRILLRFSVERSLNGKQFSDPFWIWVSHEGKS